LKVKDHSNLNGKDEMENLMTIMSMFRPFDSFSVSKVRKLNKASFSCCECIYN